MSKVDSRTIRKLKKGDKEAFETVFYAYRQKLFCVSYLYVKDYNDANDCVQEIFLRILEKIHLFDEKKATFDTWLNCLVKGYLLNYIRKKEIYDNFVSMDIEAIEKCMDKDMREIEDILIDLEAIMGEKMYAVYILRTAYNYSFDAIAEITGLKRETLRRMYYESVKIVDEYMEGERNEIKQKA